VANAQAVAEFRELSRWKFGWIVERGEQRSFVVALGHEALREAGPPRSEDPCQEVAMFAALLQAAGEFTSVAGAKADLRVGETDGYERRVVARDEHDPPSLP